MTPHELKALARKFRIAAASPASIVVIADTERAAHPDDPDVRDLCDRFEGAANEEAVLSIADEILTRKD